MCECGNVAFMQHDWTHGIPRQEGERRRGATPGQTKLLSVTVILEVPGTIFPHWLGLPQCSFLVCTYDGSLLYWSLILLRFLCAGHSFHARAFSYFVTKATGRRCPAWDHKALSLSDSMIPVYFED